MNNPSINIPLNQKEGQIFSLILNYCLSFPAIKPTSSINKKLADLQIILNNVEAVENDQVYNIEISIKSLEDILHYSKGITNEFKSYSLSGRSMIKEFQDGLEKHFPEVLQQHSSSLDILPDVRKFIDKISTIYFHQNQESHLSQEEESSQKESTLLSKIRKIFRDK
tara:strand:- start:572 stop:1072 length:501 start_codon:yes stop_codon:yes gene_type:complete